MLRGLMAEGRKTSPMGNGIVAGRRMMVGTRRKPGWFPAGVWGGCIRAGTVWGVGRYGDASDRVVVTGPDSHGRSSLGLGGTMCVWSHGLIVLLSGVGGSVDVAGIQRWDQSSDSSGLMLL